MEAMQLLDAYPLRLQCCCAAGKPGLVDVTRPMHSLRLWQGLGTHLAPCTELLAQSGPGAQEESLSVSIPITTTSPNTQHEPVNGMSEPVEDSQSLPHTQYDRRHHVNRGVCSNNLYQLRDALEVQLLAGLRDRLMDKSAIEEIVAQVSRSIISTRSNQPEQVRGLERSRAQVEAEMNNLADAIGKSGGSAFLLKALQAKESDRDSIVASLARCSPRALDSVDPDWIGTRIQAELEDIGSLLGMDAPRAKLSCTSM